MTSPDYWFIASAIMAGFLVFFVMFSTVSLDLEEIESWIIIFGMIAVFSVISDLDYFSKGFSEKNKNGVVLFKSGDIVCKNRTYSLGEYNISNGFVYTNDGHVFSLGRMECVEKDKK